MQIGKAAIKVGILGAGAMGETVIDHLKSAEGVRDVIAHDFREERIKELLGKGIRATSDLDGILADKDVPLVFVTASNSAHKELVMQALDAGKAVMCEKPIATTLEDARAMVEKAEQLGAFLQIGFELRYSKLYTKVKEWIDAGLLGDVVNSHCYYVASVWPKNSWRNKKKHCGNMFGEKLSHYVDLPRWWIGSDVTEVASYSAPNTVPYYEVRDNYHATYRFASGAVSHLTFMMGPAAHFAGDPLQNVIDQQLGDGHDLCYKVVGTKGAAATDIFRRRIRRWEYSDAPDYMHCEWVEDLTWDESEDHFYFHNTADQTLDIVDRVLKGLPPKTLPRDAYDTMRLAFAAERSTELGCPVMLDNVV